ncbi:MAG: hypothetical protein KDH48_06015 [Rhodoferax sp.]|nr:hypothetical protein [Rhodoferax sp.]
MKRRYGKPGNGTGTIRWGLGALALAIACATQAQWASNRGYQLLQRVDDVLFGVDNLSLQILDRTHVAGTLLHINVDRPYPVRSRVDFVAECATPMRLAIRTGRASDRAPLESLEFSDVSWLDGSWAAAEFACESTRQPGRAAQLAREMYERGGPPDTEVVYCDLQPDGSTEVRKGVEVRFSPSANAVSVNRQWLSSGSVTADEVRFGANSVWRINRQALDIRRSAPGGEMLFSGLCDRRAPALR